MLEHGIEDGRPGSQDRLVDVELPVSHDESEVAEAGPVEELSHVVAQLARGDFHHGEIGLARHVDGVADDADLAEDGELVVRQEAVALVHEKVSSDELLEAPVLALHEPVCPLAFCWQKEAQLSR